MDEKPVEGHRLDGDLLYSCPCLSLGEPTMRERRDVRCYIPPLHHCQIAVIALSLALLYHTWHWAANPVGRRCTRAATASAPPISPKISADPS